MPPKILDRFNRVYFIDHNVRVLGGHHYEFIKSIMGAARTINLPVQFFVDSVADPALVAETGAIRVFQDFEAAAARASERAFWRRFPRLASLWICAWMNWRFSQDLEPCFDGLDWDRSLVVVPHCSQSTVVAVARALRKRLDTGSRAVLVFPYNPGRVTFPLAFCPVAGLVRAGKVILGCDSAPLAEHYKRLTGFSFHLLPMPYQVSLPDSALPQIGPPDRPLRLLSPGEMRQEKGSDILLAALAYLHEGLRTGRLSFTFQTYLNPVHHDPIAERERVRLHELASQYPTGAITMIDQPLSSHAYHSLLAGCDAMVLPYRKANYRIRTSGVLMESLALGKPIVTTSDTWLETQMKSHGVGFAAPDGDPAALAAAIVRLANHFPALSREGAVRRDVWRQFHNPENYLRVLCGLAGGDNDLVNNLLPDQL